MSTALETAAGLAGRLPPADLSPWSMFVSADIVVQAVMVGLALASVATWTVALAKTIELRRAGRRIGALERALEGAGSLADATLKAARLPGIEATLLRDAMAEVHDSADALPDGLQERVASRLARREAAAGRRMAVGTGILATIGAVTPFVGLFGTVWGIIHSFVGIARTQTTNLAVVAPGIAEALLATAIGLVAAIPAVVIYNAFARATAGYRARLADSSAAVLRQVSRDIDRGALPLSQAAE